MLLLDQKADLGMCLTINEQRDTVVDFTVPFWEEPAAVVMSVPRNQIDPFAMLRPLDLYVWLVIALSVSVTAVAIWVLLRLSQWVLKAKRKPRTLGYWMLYCCAAFMQRGTISSQFWIFMRDDP